MPDLREDLQTTKLTNIMVNKIIFLLAASETFKSRQLNLLSHLIRKKLTISLILIILLRNS